MIEQNVLLSFKNKHVLVTGGTGLIGRQVVDILVNGGANITVVSLDQYQTNRLAKYVIGDLSDFAFCKTVTQDMDFVFHIAGIKGSVTVTKEKPASFFVPLLMMNTNILEACRINNVSKVVYTSSIGAYSSTDVFVEGVNDDGPPMDEFPGLAKRVTEQQIAAYNIQYKLKNFDCC